MPVKAYIAPLEIYHRKFAQFHLAHELKTSMFMTVSIHGDGHTFQHVCFTALLGLHLYESNGILSVTCDVIPKFNLTKRLLYI